MWWKLSLFSQAAGTWEGLSFLDRIRLANSHSLELTCFNTPKSPLPCHRQNMWRKFSLSRCLWNVGNMRLRMSPRKNVWPFVVLLAVYSMLQFIPVLIWQVDSVIYNHQSTAHRCHTPWRQQNTPRSKETFKCINHDSTNCVWGFARPFSSKKNPDSHTVCVIMSTHKEMGNNTTCLVNPISWDARRYNAWLPVRWQLKQYLWAQSWINCHGSDYVGHDWWILMFDGKIQNLPHGLCLSPFLLQQ